MILDVQGVDTFYGQSHILHQISFHIDREEAVCLLGRNGAGKTTTIRSIIGLTPPRSGNIKFQGIEIARKPPHEIARLGIGYAPDDRRIFPNLSSRENLEIARRTEKGRDPAWTVDKVYDIFPMLKGLDSRMGRLLSGGEQKMLSIARALMIDAKLLILDEPSEGLGPLVLHGLIECIQRIKDEGVTLLIADQNVKFTRRVAERGYIIEKGTIRYEDQVSKIWENHEILKRYLTV
jgi:branched-chain amino acid transport system ATP-binding protein